MKNLPTELLVEKNKLATPNAWLLFMDVVLPDLTEFHLVNNTENLTFQGKEYTAINFDIDPDQQLSKGEIPSLDLMVANVTRILQTYLEELNGALGASVVLWVVNSTHLASDYAELKMEREVMGAQASDLWVTFNLGASNPLRRRGMANLGALNSGNAGGGAPNVVINIENKSSTPVDAKQGSVKFDGKQYVTSIILSDLQGYGPIRSALQGMK